MSHKLAMDQSSVKVRLIVYMFCHIKKKIISIFTF